MRTKDDPPAGGQGRSPIGEMLVASAVELSPHPSGADCRLRRHQPRAFVAGAAAPGARVITDDWSGYGGLPDQDHDPKVIAAR